MTHTCTVCHGPAFAHPEKCPLTHSDGSDRHFPPLCCPGCECRSFEEAHSLGGHPTIHELKCWEEPFDAIARGDKKHEVRVNDRGFKAGHALFLRRWNHLENEYTRMPGTGGRSFLTVLVTYLTPPGTWGLPDNLCVMSIVPIDWNRRARG